MYLLLSQLSLMDLMYISTTVPNMVVNFLSGQKSISFLGCGEQRFFFLTMACSEGLLMASIAYDYFVAIRHPLHDPIHMSKRMCAKMIAGSWMLGSINSRAQTVYALHLPCCRSRAIDHFFCDVPGMLPLACVDLCSFCLHFLWPRILHSPVEDKVLAVFCTILMPMLNPIIYSLRNKEVLGTMERLFGILFSKNK
ncbi:Olfactory receptor 2L13 [Heterocephalus glaber]|uniref:Olfactory receptor 2L13 n=1 Tax=Heterocephalus glaber TaxID=10181 RepID=G5ANF8_HETGA|nr:Olfactory receptor 2L13 [Heterocephalus glaber]